MIVIKTNLSEFPKSCAECTLKTEIKTGNRETLYYCVNGKYIHLDPKFECIADCPIVETDSIIVACENCNGTGIIEETKLSSGFKNSTTVENSYSDTTVAYRTSKTICTKCNGTGKVKIMDKNGCVE